MRLNLSDLPMPVAASAQADATPPQKPPPQKPSPPLELDLQDDLPTVASPQKRPPPRRHRPAAAEVPAIEDAADLPARPEDIDVGLPAVAAPPPPPRPLDRAPRPPSRQKSPPLDDLDLPATAPRELPIAGLPLARPPLPEPMLAKDAGLSLDLPSVPRARPAPPGLSDADLPAIGRAQPPLDRPAFGRAQPGVDLPAVGRGQPAADRSLAARGQAGADLPTVGRAQPAGDLPAAFRAPTKVDLAAAQRAQKSIDLPTVGHVSGAELPAIGRGQPAPGRAAPIPSDLPDVLGGGPAMPAFAPNHDVIALPEVLSTGLPDVVAPGLPRPAQPHDDLPGVLGGFDDFAEAPAPGLPAARSTGFPRVSDSGLPDVLGGGSHLSAAGLPAVQAAGLPQLSESGLPDVLGAGLPEVHGTGLPDVLTAGLPEVHGTGLPDVLASGLPIVSSAALPQVRPPNASGFGRIDLPVPRAADLPARMGFDEVDLPGVGESLPSVSENWGAGNLPTVGETLPTAKGQHGFDEAGTAFDAFGDPGADDPFAGSEAQFGAPEGDDPFAAPVGAAGGEFAGAGYGDDQAPEAPAAGAGYGEVDIGGTDGGDSALETADDMEFQAIPQRGSAPPGRAAASASVHADSPDADATGSTLELGPERKAPKPRTRRIIAATAVALGTVAGGALALKPAIGPFGIHFVMDQINRGEHERLLTQLVSDAREAAARDTLSELQGSLRALEKARADAPRFWPLSARSAFEHYDAALRYGPLPNLEAAAKVALDQLEPDTDDARARLARAAQAAVSRAADAKSRLQGLGSDPDAKQLLGELSLRDQDWAGAEKLWSEVKKTEPKSARATFGLARAQLGLGKLPEAIAGARETLSIEPAHVGAPILLLETQRAQLGASDAAAGKSATTEELVAAVMRVLPNAAPGEAALGHCVLGELHERQGRSGPAQQEFEAALVVDRAMPRALIGLGEVLHEAGRDSEALARFEAAARAEPKSLQAQIGIAKTQIQLAHLPEAKTVLTRLNESYKDHPDVIYWTGRSEQALGNNDAALAAYRASINASKGQAGAVDAYLALAKLQADLGQLAVAQETLNEARGKLPPNGPLHKALGEIAMSRADYSGAYEHFQKALDLDSGDTRARFFGAVALTRLGRFDEALTAFQTVGKTDKDFPGLAVERGRLFEESGRNAEALTEFEAALKKTPDDPEVQIRAGCSRVVAGQAAAAQQVLEIAAKARPRSAEANYCLGRALFDQERLSDGMQRLERAVGLDPTRAVYHQFLGWVASEMGRQGDAQEAFDKAIELDKGLADAYWLRGRLRLKQGASRDAIVDLERARQLKPSRYDAIADLAVAYADTGRLRLALDSWEEAIAKDPDNPTWHFRYGKLLSSSGNGQMAAAHLRRAIDLVSESAQSSGGSKSKSPPWLWQAHYLLARELGVVPASIPHWQAYLRLSARDDPYRPEAERALRDLGQPWVQR
ncbi:MAG TPA: tetratricopeptide repeat protein [Polyangiaceae bacterium]|nr:tetratricopeptide repeat protein [Polyangiaceae bacterium]